MADLHRQVAALAVAAGHAGVDHQDLTLVRARVARQRSRFVEAAVATGTASPILTPTPGEIATGGSRLGDLTPEAVGGAMRTASSTLDTVDAALSTYLAGRSQVSTAVRDGSIYAGYAMGVVGLQVVLFLSLDETKLALAAPFCLVVLPAFAWLAGWATIGMAFGPGGGSHRHARLGAIICLLPDVLLCAITGLLYLLKG